MLKAGWNKALMGSFHHYHCYCFPILTITIWQILHQAKTNGISGSMINVSQKIPKKSWSTPNTNWPKSRTAGPRGHCRSACVFEGVLGVAQQSLPDSKRLTTLSSHISPLKIRQGHNFICPCFCLTILAVVMQDLWAYRIHNRVHVRFKKPWESFR